MKMLLVITALLTGCVSPQFYQAQGQPRMPKMMVGQAVGQYKVSIKVVPEGHDNVPGELRWITDGEGTYVYVGGRL